MLTQAFLNEMISQLKCPYKLADLQFEAEEANYGNHQLPPSPTACQSRLNHLFFQHLNHFCRGTYFDQANWSPVQIWRLWFTARDIR